MSRELDVVTLGGDEYDALVDERDALRAELAAERKRREAAEALLMRYRNEVSLGHSPHMICGDVDDHFAHYKD